MSEPDVSLESIRQRIAKLLELRLDPSLTHTEEVEYLDLVALEAEELAQRDRRT